MNADLEDLGALLAVARAGGFREAARAGGGSASALSEAVRRLEAQLGVRLLHRTTRSVSPTEAGAQLIARVAPALGEVEAALAAAGERGGRPAGTLKLNVPISAARLVLPAIVPGFLAAYPEVRLEVFAQDSFVDLVASGCDAGIRYDERLEQDMITVPIGPRVQRMATAAAPAYLAVRGRPEHPRDLLDHACILGTFEGGRRATPWEFARGAETARVDPSGPLTVQVAAFDLALDAAVAGVGVIHLFEAWLRPHLDSGALKPVLEDWWEPFPGPFLYYSGRKLVPPPLRALLDHVAAMR